MFKTSHLQELKRRYREMYASSEEGTDELVDQYKKETPGQKEDTDKDKPGTQGDQAEYQKKRKEIAKKFGVDACAQLKDEDKKKACFAALDASHVSDDEEEDEDDDPVGKNEEKNYDYDGKVVKISKKNFRKVHKDYKNSTKGKERMLILDPKTQGSISVPVKFTEEVELNEGGDQIWFKGIGMTFDEFSLIFATMYVPGSRVLPTEVAPDNSKYGSLLKKLSRKDQKWVVSLLKDYMKRGGVVHKDVVKNFVLKEEVELDEAAPMYPPTIKNLRMIVKDKQNQVFMFKVGKARVDTFTASAIVAVYDGLKKSEHKKKLEDMIKTKEGFLKTQSFAMKMVK